MAEETGEENSKLGFRSVLRGHTEAPKSGIRILQKIENNNPLTLVEHGRSGSIEYYQQKFQKEAFSPYWRGYAKDKDRNVTGVLLDNDILFWIPLDKSLISQTMLNLVKRKYPQSQIVGKFNLKGRPMLGEVPELVLESNVESFDSQMDGLVDYFGKSLNWEERIVKLKIADAKGKNIFSGSLQEYLMSH